MQTKLAVTPELPLNPVYTAISRWCRCKSQQNKAGESSFGIICEQVHTQVVRCLLEHGIRCQAQDA